MKSIVKFSIAIPAYKQSYLKEAVDSVLAQTYMDFELIIVNDTSPYDLDSIVNSYSDSKIRYYKNEKNCGDINVVDNWNKCLEYANGEYIICMGDDDVLLPNCLEEYDKLIKKYPGLGVYHVWTQIIDEKSNFVNFTAARPEFESVYSLIWHRWDNRKQQFIGDFLFDTQMLKKNGGFYKLPLAWGSDDLSAIIAAIPNGIANTQKICFCYRINSRTISNTGNALIKLNAINAEMNWYKDFLKSKPSDSLDEKYWICIQKAFELHFQKKKGLIVAKDLKKHTLINLCKWIFMCGKYGIKPKVLIWALMQTLKGRA